MDSTTSKNRGPWWGIYQKMVTGDLLFHLFTTIYPIIHDLKSTRLGKIYISTWKYYLSEGNFSPIWRNDLGNNILDSIADPTVSFKIITNIISSNPIYQMVVPFTLVLIHWQTKYQSRERERRQTENKKFQSQRKTYNWTTTQISSNIHWLPSTKVLDHDSKSSKISNRWYKY